MFSTILSNSLTHLSTSIDCRPNTYKTGRREVLICKSQYAAYIAGEDEERYIVRAEARAAIMYNEVGVDMFCSNFIDTAASIRRIC